jgi:hypothetical protein
MSSLILLKENIFCMPRFTAHPTLYYSILTFLYSYFFVFFLFLLPPLLKLTQDYLWSLHLKFLSFSFPFFPVPLVYSFSSPTYGWMYFLFPQANTFTEKLNNHTKCQLCKKRCEPSMVVSSKCTSKKDMTCSCRKGRYLDPGILVCVLCDTCSVGYGATQACNTNTNTICAPCVTVCNKATTFPIRVDLVLEWTH